MSEYHQLKQILCESIEKSGGFMPFDQFMQAALYQPRLGYYESKTVFGEKGDFVTAPELGPWLSLGYADLIFSAWQQMGEPQQWRLLEQGAGSGKLLVSLLGLIAQFSMPYPTAVISVERSAQLRARQAELFAERGLDVEVVAGLDKVEAAEHMIIFTNELPDAFPVRCFSWKNETYFERGVGLCEEGFCWKDGPEIKDERPDISAGLTAGWADGYISEWNPALSDWQSKISDIVISGFVFTVDYGYSQQEYYRSGRSEGSLLAHIGQQASEDVLSEPGSRDITAHVDFTALVKAGEACGLSPLLWMSQGGWLAQSPAVQSFVQSLAMQNDAVSMHLMAHAKRLLMPMGMGEVFKLLVQVKGLNAQKPDYLKQFDHLDHLQS